MDTSHASHAETDRLIQALGGDVAAAAFWQITRQAVAKFRREGRIPNARMLHLRAARPDLFSDSVERPAE